MGHSSCITHGSLYRIGGRIRGVGHWRVWRGYGTVANGVITMAVEWARIGGVDGCFYRRIRRPVYAGILATPFYDQLSEQTESLLIGPDLM